jgi:hypothetical protein
MAAVKRKALAPSAVRVGRLRSLPGRSRRDGTRRMTRERPVWFCKGLRGNSLGLLGEGRGKVSCRWMSSAPPFGKGGEGICLR